MFAKIINRIKQYKVLIWGALFIGLLLLAGRSASPAPKNQIPPLLLNEMVASNSSGLTDEDGDFSDWIELYNPGRQPINLAGFALTDDIDQPEKWTFPDLTLPGGAYLLVFASGKNRQNPAEPLHTNFKLNQSGDFVGLYNILDRRFVDTVTARRHFKDTAYGRYGDAATLGYLAIPSPGGANIEGQFWADAVAPVEFSVLHGFFSQPFSVTLATITPDATIRYTLDGSQPTETHGQLYTHPLEITSTSLLQATAFRPGYLPAAVDTHSYIFINDVLAQSATPAGFPATWGNYREPFNGHAAGDPVQADYEMDPEITTSQRQALIEGLTAIPSLSLVMDSRHFADIYANPRERGPAWERPLSVELIYPNGDQPGFQINGGVRIQGGVGRKENIPKHSFRLFFRNEYGNARLDYPLFPNAPVTEFDTLVLRGGVNRSFAAIVNHKTSTYIHDEWLRTSQIEMSGLSAHGIYVHLYINGLYWGLYNLVERPDANFMASYLGGDKDNWLVFNHSGPVDGDLTQIESLMTSFFAVAFYKDNPTIRQESIDTILSLVDWVQFSDFLILNWYAGNQDWGENNWYIGLYPPNGKINYLIWDGEKTFYNGANIYMGQNASPSSDVVEPVLNLLLQDPDFQMVLADRMYHHLYHNGALTDTQAQARWNRLSQSIEKAIIGESARWGDVRQPEAISQQDWVAANNQVLAQITGNADKLIRLAREQGLYPAIDPPTFNQQGGLISPNFALQLVAPPNVTIYYTVDGSDPRLPGGAIAPVALPYTGPITLNQTTTINSRANLNGVWSALNQAEFRVTDQVSQLVISELMYNPWGGPDFEFIELTNSGNTPFNLANLTFEGISFTFPANTPALLPGERLVLAANEAAFSQRYPNNVPIGGIYQDNLSNKGELITLKTPEGDIILALNYDDENGWPLSADGRGDSLIFPNPTSDPNQPKNWQASSQLYGSPGRADALETTLAPKEYQNE